MCEVKVRTGRNTHPHKDTKAQRIMSKGSASMDRGRKSRAAIRGSKDWEKAARCHVSCLGLVDCAFLVSLCLCVEAG